MTSLTELHDNDALLIEALSRCDKFDLQAFTSWLTTRTPYLQRTAKLVPPNRIYDFETWTVCIKGYGRDGHVIVSKIIGDQGADYHCDPGELKDITDEVRSKFKLI